ncbi:MAG: hypothetical protein IKQ37_00385 [Bacteroidaceae bacterium]|nr:hypothetical protein [Bacteroidaceae bacterium]
MKTRTIFAALLLIAAVSQTVRAQKVLIYKTDKTQVELKTSEVDSMVFVPEEPLLTCPDDNHPHAIDLGLPSGTKWACCNVGASTPEGYGGYYAWGETCEKNAYNWDTYAYGSSWDNCVNIGSDIAGTSYDVAHVRMGAPWRMPSTGQQQELINNCSSQWTQQNGVNGMLVTGRNGGQIFLPAAGYRWDDYLDNAGSYGYYWSSSHYRGFVGGAYSMYSSGYWCWDGLGRGFGLSVRAVCP